jgi:hypothetical protein
VFGQQVDTRAREEREIDVRDRRIPGTIVGGAALVEDAPGVGRHRRWQLVDELGERQLANVITERGNVIAARTPLDDKRQPRAGIAGQITQEPPISRRAAVGGGDHQLAHQFGAQPDRRRRRVSPPRYLVISLVRAQCSDPRCSCRGSRSHRRARRAGRALTHRVPAPAPTPSRHGTDGRVCG